MSILQNFPFKNQLHEPDIDGIPDINADMNCLPTCIACGMQYLTGREYTGEEIEHAVYGRTYMGGTSAIEYVDYCATHGVHLSPINGSGNYLVQQIHQQLASGHPVIGTIPSTYLPPQDPDNPGMSHCIIFYKDDTTMLYAMNPWQAFVHSGSDEYWALRLCFHQIWLMTKEQTTMVPNGWKDNGTELVAPNGIKVVRGFRQYVLSRNWHPENFPIEEEHADASIGGTAQTFTYGALCWNSKRGVWESEIGVYCLNLQKQMQSLQSALQKAPTIPNIDAALQALKPLGDLYLTLQNLKGQH